MNSPAAEPVKAARDNTPSPAYAKFMSEGWVPSDLDDVVAGPAVTSAFLRRATLSAQYPGVRLVLPAGGFKVRSNDTDYRFRPHSAFAYYSGVQGVEASADAVLVLEPTDTGHETFLYIHPRSTRDTHAFYTDRRFGELWVGRRFTLSEAQARYQIETRRVDDLEALLKDGAAALTIRGEDPMIDKNVAVHPQEKDFVTYTSAARLVKDEYEISELQRACDETAKGFADVVRSLPAAVSTPRGERVVEAAFFGRARIAGNDLGYETIAASGSHACVLHWIQNDGEVRPGELILVDAGIEMDSFYTADITRTLPISGKFSPAQRALSQSCTSIPSMWLTPCSVQRRCKPFSGNKDSSGDIGKTPISDSPFARTAWHAVLIDLNVAPGFTAAKPASCASYTNIYKARCAGENFPEIGNVRVISAV